jgi:hypothetical protein
MLLNGVRKREIERKKAQIDEARYMRKEEARKLAERIAEK